MSEWDGRRCHCHLCAVCSNWRVATLLWPSQYFYVQSDPWRAFILFLYIGRVAGSSSFIIYTISHWHSFQVFHLFFPPLEIVSRQLICKQSHERYAFCTQRALCQIVKYLPQFTLCNIFRTNEERKAAEKRDVNLKFKPIDEREWKKAIKIEHKDRLPEWGVSAIVFGSMFDGLSRSFPYPHFSFITNEQRSDPNQKWKWRSSRASVINELAVTAAVVAAIAADFCIHIFQVEIFHSRAVFFCCLFSFLWPDNKWQPISGKMREICSLKKFLFCSNFFFWAKPKKRPFGTSRCAIWQKRNK